MCTFLLMKAHRCILSILFILLAGSSPSYAWSLRTHIWIGQQVINDVLADGMIHIGKKQYPVANYIVEALRQYPQMFRAGNLGPDLFPDPIVGQITTHPGLAGGWSTDQWLGHLLKNSRKPQDVALAFGFMCHAAGDMFAHTYVNQYAGDIFSLLDDERDVELRHFVLEKYIERATPLPYTLDGQPINWEKDIMVSEAYLAEQLILNESVFKQYTKSGTGLHLAAMYGVKTAVDVLDEQNNKLIAELTKWGGKYVSAHAKLVIDMTTGKQLITAAELSLKQQELTLLAEEAAYKAALDIFNEANSIMDKYPGLINYQKELLVIQTKAAAEALKFSTDVASEVNQVVSGLENQIRSAEDRISGEVCRVLKKIPFVGKIMSSGCKEIDKLRAQIRGIQNNISGHRQRAAAATVAANAAESLRDKTSAEVNRLSNIYNEAERGIREGTYKAAVIAADTKVKKQRELIVKQQKIVAELKAKQEKMVEEFNIVDDIIKKMEELVRKYNAITLLIGNWNDGITKATEAFILAGNSAGAKLLRGEGNPIDDYTRWFSCYGSVYTGVPSQFPEAACSVADNLEKIKNKYDEMIASLPEILQWTINPTKKAQDLAYKQLEPALKNASYQIAKFLTDKKSAEFLQLLTGQSYATREKLNQVYSEDKSGKKLLLFTDVHLLIDQDLFLKDGVLNPEMFKPLAHSLTMAKLALLEPAVLNQVIGDLVGDYKSPFFGTEIYQPQGDRFSILLGVLASIDGNHQWQAYALPYPRRVANANLPKYGYDYYKDKTKGLKIWVDPYLRERVFTVLFPGSVMGALGQRSELRWPNYKFPECAAYLFPSTQEVGGTLKGHDVVCNDLWNPNVSPAYMLTTQLEFKARYHQCDTIIWGDKHWTIVGSYYNKEDADTYRSEIEMTYPDLHVTIAEQQSGQRFWAIMLSSCTDSVRANEAKNIAIRRRIAPDAYVWKHAEVFRTEPRALNRRRRK